MTSVHQPILVQPIVQTLLEPFLRLPMNAAPHWMIDCTLGGGGHCAAFLEALSTEPRLKQHRILAIDQDQLAIHNAQTRFPGEIAGHQLHLQHQRFSQLQDFVRTHPVLGLLADLGFSSDQVQDPNRGLSFQKNGPLDMRLDVTRGMSCHEFLLQISETELEKILWEYGEERFARRIAKGILSKIRIQQPPQTTQELVSIVLHAVPSSARKGRLHIATRTFQALRIAVNQELFELDCLLKNVIHWIHPGGRVAIMSFHSLEDRRVKQALLKDEAGRKHFLPLHKKPMSASTDEIKKNIRARSAKLRMAERLPPSLESEHTA